MKEKTVTLTVFTPTYNRGYCLSRGFEALKRQSCKDFIWLIVDDGSTDDTKDVVRRFQEENCGFEIRYYFKENGGLHTGYNTAIEHADTELCMCIDSDDWIADDAIARIIATWKIRKRADCAGIVGLDADSKGNPVCRIHTNEPYINLNEYDATHKWEGDRKLIIRTDLYKSVAPMPSVAGEKNFNPQYMHIRIAQDYSFYVLNEALCIVDYQDTGMSAGIFRQYLNSPNSFAEYRRLKMTIKPNRFSRLVRDAIHYDSSCILAGKPEETVSKSPKPVLTAGVLPVGWLLSKYVRFKARDESVPKADV